MLDHWLVQGLIQNTVWAILVLAAGYLVARMSTKSHNYATNALYGLAAAVLTLFLIVQGKALYYSGSEPQQQDKTEDNRTVSQLKPLVRIEGRKFVNEKVELDGHSYVNCDFENVTFVYNGGLSEVFNSRVKYQSRLRFETTSVPVQQVIKMFRGMGLFHPDSIVPDPAVR